MQVCDIMKLPNDAAVGCDMTFTDPPWEQGLVKMFETLMFKAGYERPGNNIDDLLHRLFILAPDGYPCFVDYSVKGAQRVARIGREHGFELSGVVLLEQANSKPYASIQFNTDFSNEGDLSGWGLIRAVLRYHKPNKVFEPFAGLGVLARQCIALGIDVVASEMNPKRAERAFKALKL